MLEPIKVGPDLGGLREKDVGTEGREEEEEEDTDNGELAAPVLMLSELERPNMVVAARRPASRNA